MPAFTPQNTDGFSADELREMNAAFIELDNPADSADERKTLCERILDAAHGHFTALDLVARCRHRTPPAARLHGLDAVDYAETHNRTLNKYADPVSGAESGLSVDDARDVCREDPSLIYLDPTGVESVHPPRP